MKWWHISIGSALVALAFVLVPDASWPAGAPASWPRLVIGVGVVVPLLKGWLEYRRRNKLFFAFLMLSTGWLAINSLPAITAIVPLPYWLEQATAVVKIDGVDWSFNVAFAIVATILLYRCKDPTPSSPSDPARADHQGDASDCTTDFRWERHRYGAIHGSSHPSGLLVVFVHGILGSARGTWKDLPRFISEHTNDTATLFSFSYPAWPFFESNIRLAACDLTTVLATSFSEYPHVVIIGHSCGGLVAKAMLSPQNEDHASTAVWRRVRSVMTLATPSRGATTLISYGLIIPYTILNYALWPLLILLRYASLQKWQLGINNLTWELSSVSSLPQSITIALRRKITIAAEGGRLHPFLCEFEGTSDEAISRLPAGTPQRLDVGFHQGQLPRLTHLSINNPPGVDDIVVKQLVHCGQLNAYDGSVLEKLVLRAIIDRCDDVDAQTRVRTILDGSIDGGGQSQSEVLASVQRHMSQKRDEPIPVLITGDVGTGKSSVARAYARQVAVDALVPQHGSGRALVMLFPLQQLSSEDIGGRPKDGAELFARLLAYWSAWAENILRSQRYTNDLDLRSLDCNTGQLLNTLKTIVGERPVTIAFDSVDEFLTGVDRIDIHLFADMIRHLQRVVLRREGTNILLACRSGWSSTVLKTLPDSIELEVGTPSKETARRCFPGAKRVLDRLAPEVEAAVRIPLILAQLEDSLDSLSDSRVSVMEGALKTKISRSWDLAHVEETLLAVACVAWIYFISGRTAMTTDEILDLARDLLEGWSAHSEAASNEAISTDVQLIIAGLTRVGDRLELVRVLSQTVFAQTHTDRYRFQHKEWQEYGVARYFAEVLGASFVDELRYVALTEKMYSDAGTIMMNRDMKIHYSIVRAALGEQVRAGNRFTPASLLAFFSHAEIEIPAEAHRYLCNAEFYFEMDYVSRFISLNALSYRAFSHKSDRRLAELVRKLLGECLRMYRDSHPITASLCWNYLQYASVEKPGSYSAAEPPPLNPESECWLTKRIVERATGMVAPIIRVDSRKERFSEREELQLEIGDLDAPHRSIQMALLLSHHTVKKAPELRPIGFVHYLLILSIARRYLCHIAEVEEILPNLLDPDSDCGSIITACPHGNVRSLFNACQRLVD